MKIRKEATNQNQAEQVCRLDKWDDVQVQWFGAVVQKTDTSFFLWSDSELGRVLGYLYIFSDHVLCCMMASDHQKVVTKKSSKNSLCETWISLATKVNQWLYHITHSSSIGLLSMLSLYQMSCFALAVTEVRYTPCLLFTQGEGELLVLFQFFPAAQWSETLYIAVPHLNFLYSLDLTVSMLSQEKFSFSGSLLAA